MTPGRFESGHSRRGELCDDGNNRPGDRCPVTCGALCGNGRLDPGDACDDGNFVNGDGCAADCRSTEACGNAVLDPGEACDDGDARSHDHCSRSCTIETEAWAASDAGPGMRAGHAMAYDAARGVVVPFGGRGASGPSGELWTWDGTTWCAHASAMGEPSRQGWLSSREQRLSQSHMQSRTSVVAVRPRPKPIAPKELGTSDLERSSRTDLLQQLQGRFPHWGPTRSCPTRTCSAQFTS